MATRAAPSGAQPAPTTRVKAARTAKATVYDELRDLIVELELMPGIRLVEADLAGHFGVSKTPIREAFVRLEAEGLVEMVPYQGASVSWMSQQEHRELIFLQDTLEFAALPEVVETLRPDALRTARRLLKDLRRARAARASREFGRVGVELHRCLFANPDAPRLPRMVTALLGGPGRRYERVFQHQFDDAWDLELETLAGRLEHVAGRDAEGAIRHVRACHERTLRLADGRLQDPRVEPYLRPPGGRPLGAVLKRARARHQADAEGAAPGVGSP